MARARPRPGRRAGWLADSLFSPDSASTGVRGQAHRVGHKKKKTANQMLFPSSCYPPVHRREDVCLCSLVILILARTCQTARPASLPATCSFPGARCSAVVVVSDFKHRLPVRSDASIHSSWNNWHDTSGNTLAMHAGIVISDCTFLVSLSSCLLVVFLFPFSFFPFPCPFPSLVPQCLPHINRLFF